MEMDDSKAAAAAKVKETVPSVETVLESVQALASRFRCLGTKPNEKDDYDDSGKNPNVESDSGSISSTFGDTVTTGVGANDVASETLMCSRLREATCLLLLAERFPTGFLDNEALFGLLVAADALDSICVRLLLRLIGEEESGRWNKDSCPAVALALVETVVALRRLLLVLLVRLRRESPVTLLLRSPPTYTDSPSLKRDRFSPGEALLRVADPLIFTVSRSVAATAGEGCRGGIVALLLLQQQQLLRSSSAWLPMLAELCVSKRQTKVVFEAVARLAVPWAGDETAGDGSGLLDPKKKQRTHKSASEACLRSEGEDRRYDREWRLFLLHGVLSGFVAGETRRLKDSSAAASAATTTVIPMVTKNSAGSDGDKEGDKQEEVQTNRQPLELPPLEHQRLFATVSRLADCLPTSASAAAALGGEPQAPLSPTHLVILGDALRLSFLGANVDRLVFAVPSAMKMYRHGREERTRSQWVEDAVLYLRYRAMVAVVDAAAVTGESPAVEVSAVDGSGKREGWGLRYGQGRERHGSRGVSQRKRVMTSHVGNGHIAGEVGFSDDGCDVVSERSASCQLLRAVCGCSHLLDPPLPRSVIRSLVEAFLFLFLIDGKGSRYGGEGEKETLLLETAFCLLVQQASKEQLDEIFATLLGALTITVTTAVIAEEDGKDDCDRRLFRACSAVHACPHCVENMAVALARLAARAAAGNSKVFQAVASDRTLALTAGLCRSLRRTMVVTEAGRDAAHCACLRAGGKLRSAAEALDGLESLLSRGRGVSATARVVSFVLGSIEPAVRAALDAVEVLRIGSPSAADVGKIDTDYDGCREGVHDSEGRGKGENRFVCREEIVRCFRACCRVLKTLLQVHSRKVFSCAAPFAALCRSLLRLLFCLASAAPPEPRTGRVKSAKDAPPAAQLVSLDEQISVASALSRVLEEFLPNGDVLRRYAAFLLLEYVSLAGSSTLEPAPRTALEAGVFAVMEACTRREMRQLHGLLAASSSVDREVFRSLNEEYQRRHKFTGNI